RVEKEPVVVELIDPRTKQKVKVTVTRFVIQYLSANNIGTTVIEEYPRAFYAASKGDFSFFAEGWLNLASGGIGSAMSYMMDCASGITSKRRELISREAKQT